MAADSFAPGWLLLLVQLPSKPSSARVALWRRLRAIGATTMVNGAWVLPDTAAHAALFGKLRVRVLRQGGTAFVVSIPGSPFATGRPSSSTLTRRYPVGVPPR